MWIGSGAARQIPEIFKGRGATSSLHLVTDSRVYRQHGSRIERLLHSTGMAVRRTVLPAGEKSKSVGQLERIWRGAARGRVGR